MSNKMPAISDVQRRIANTSIGASTLRGQMPGSVQIARQYLRTLDLRELGNLNESEFAHWLEDRTHELKEKLPEPSWGVARKAINIFLENAFYDKFLSGQYKLDALEAALEIPLDSNVANGLSRDLEANGIRFPLPKWDRIKTLSPQVSRKFQDCAQAIAHLKQTSRIYLDLEYWRGGKEIGSPGIQ